MSGARPKEGPAPAGKGHVGKAPAGKGHAANTVRPKGQRRIVAGSFRRIAPVMLPVAALLIGLAFWQYYVTANDVPKFVLPSPGLIWAALVADAPLWWQASLSTLSVTVQALFFATLSGVLLAFLFSVSRTFEAIVYPFAVVLQVTPIIAVAPLVLIWVGLDNINLAQLIIAWLVAFFPILANMSAGLRSVDQNLDELFRLYGASPLQRFRWLLVPTALPYLLASLRISGGLALIGGVVAEFVAGSGAATGLAWRIIEAGNRLQIERMFAGLILLAAIGTLLFYGFMALEWFARHHMRSK